MILLLSTRKKIRVEPDLSALGKVRRLRVPAEPADKHINLDEGPHATRPRRTNPDWAYRRLASTNRLISEKGVQVVVCADKKAHRFAHKLAEQHPTIPVFPDQLIAARVLAELEQRNQPVTRQAVHDLLDPLRLSLPPVPDYLFDRTARAPLVVSLVQNIVDGDSRVQKVAESLAEAGYQSVLLGTNPPDEPEGDWYMIGDAVVLRFPVAKDLYLGQKNSPPGPLLTRVFGYQTSQQDRAAWHRYERRLATDATGSEPGLRLRAAGRIVEWRSWLYRRNRRSFQNIEYRSSTHQRQASRIAKRINRSDPESAYPLIDDIEEQFAPAIDALKPAALHVHDPMLLGIAVRARQRLARLGIDCRIIFDAHEWTAGVRREHALHSAAMIRLEKQFLPHTDRCVTVSDEIADLMVTELPLTQRPTVVKNAPRSGIDTDYPDVRSAADVPKDAPLLVYVGGIAERRGVDDLLEALVLLPEAYLVVVTPKEPRMLQLRRRAKELGVSPRLRRLDYVPANKVTSYLRTADIGVIPFRPLLNSELGVPTKYREYLLAGLPIVATDLGATAKEIRATGVGELCRDSAPKSLAKAIRKVLRNKQQYTDRITPELLQADCWETQSAALLDIYTDLLGPPPGTGAAAAIPAAATPPIADAEHRVVIGATNSAGQGYEWARALRSAGVAATSLELRLAENSFTHAVDVSIPREAVRTLDRRVQLLLHTLGAADTIVMESARPIAAPEPGDVDSRLLGFREARALQASGRNIGLIFHGSDIRRPDLHMRSHDWSPFRDPKAAGLTQELRARTQIVHQELATWDGPVMVSTPDLIHTTPAAVWTPVVVDLANFPLADPDARQDSGPPVVVHMPSRSILKGSHLIDPILHRLAHEGVIRYHRVEKARHEAVPGILAECDIFVDQLGMGIFGVAPLEAMAIGATVVTDPGPEAQEIYGEALPVVVADVTTFEQRVRDIAHDHEQRQELRLVGRSFVERHHDGRVSGAAMQTALGIGEW